MGMRIGGLATGMDTDNMIKNMMKPYNMRVDKMKQKAQRVQWQQEAYRNVMSGVSDISKKYFDVLNGENYLLSSKNFSSLKPSGIPDTSNLKVNAGSGAASGNYTMNVTQLASKAQATGTNIININTLSEGSYGIKIDVSNNKMTIDGKEITLTEKGYGNLSDLAAEINSKIDGNVDLKDTVKAVVENGNIKIQSLTGGTANLTGTLNGIGITGTDVTVSGDTITYAKEIIIIKDFNDTFNVQIGNNASVTVTLAEGTIDTVENLSKKLNDELKAAGITDTKLTSTVKDGKIILSSKSNERVMITAETGKSATSLLGLPDRYEMSMSTSEKMSNIVSTAVQFTINGVDFNYDFTKDYDPTTEEGKKGAKDKTIAQIMSEISDKAKVDISYSEINKNFIIRSKEEGSTGKIAANDTTGSFLQTLFGKASINESGKDAKIELTTPNNSTATTIVKDSNNFTIDGVNYNIAGAEVGKSISFSLNGNVDDSFNKIKGFIEDYNKLVDELQKKVTEKKYRKYEPLTEEQKKDMKENDIKLWEEKAQSGILRSDSNVQNMLSSMRKAFFASVEGAGISLKEIGLTTSKDYKEGGKIIFDQALDKDGNNGEARLKKLLKEDPDKVFKIFSQESTTHPSYSPDLTTSQREKRYNEEGIFQRINDIFKDYTRTTRSATGRRGIFVEKAGIKGTVSEIDNILYKDLEKREKVINEMELKLAERENKYYLQFAQLEKYINNANAQSGWLAQQLGGGRG